eukprot:gene19061-20976_t
MARFTSQSSVLSRKTPRNLIATKQPKLVENQHSKYTDVLKFGGNLDKS